MRQTEGFARAFGQALAAGGKPKLKGQTMTETDCEDLLQGTTLGPWHARDSQDDPHYAEIDAPNKEWDALARVVVAFDGEGPTKEGRANARLIAASPTIAAENVALKARIEHLQSENERLREAVEPSGDTKAAYHGEFAFDLYEGVSDAGIDQYRKVYVPWDTVKRIMAAVRYRATLQEQPE